MQERARQELAVVETVKKLRLEIFGDGLNPGRVDGGRGVAAARH